MSERPGSGKKQMNYFVGRVPILRSQYTSRPIASCLFQLILTRFNLTPRDLWVNSTLVSSWCLYKENYLREITFTRNQDPPPSVSCTELRQPSDKRTTRKTAYGHCVILEATSKKRTCDGQCRPKWALQRKPKTTTQATLDGSKPSQRGAKG